MIILLTRHGQTVENINHIIQGQMDGKLSPEGEKQVKLLAKRLSKEKIDAVYSSDLGRCRQTTEAIMKYQNCPLNYVKELRERDHGDFTGKFHKDCNWDNPPKNQETHAHMRERAQKIVDELYKQYKEGTVVLVGHGAINTMLVSVIEKQEYDNKKFWGINKEMKNTSVSKFEITKDGTKIVYTNDASHLNSNPTETV